MSLKMKQNKKKDSPTEWQISDVQSVEELDKLFQNIISKLHDPENWGNNLE